MSEKRILDYQEVLELLSRQALDGSTAAAVALERALRKQAERDDDEVGHAIDQILAKSDGG